MLFVQSTSDRGDVPRLKDICHERTLQFNGFNCYQWSFIALSDALTSFSFFNGDETRSDAHKFDKSLSKTPRRDLFNGRQWTNILLATNIL